MNILTWTREEYDTVDKYGSVFAFIGIYAGRNDAGLVLTLQLPDQIKEIILDKLSVKGFFLKHEIKIAIDIEIDGYILSNEDLNVHIFGKTIDSAQLEWENVLVDLYLSYRDTPDDQLAVSGKILKDRLQEAIGESNADQVSRCKKEP